MIEKMRDLYALEKLSDGDSMVHRLHPLVKLVTTAMFMLIVLSFDRYAVMGLLPYLLFPTLLMVLSKTPYTLLLKRFLAALPFCLLAGVSNLLFDTDIAFLIGGLAVSYGFLSLLAILLRSYLCVLAVLVLVSVTPFFEITAAMRRLGIPLLFTVIFEMIYRYIGVLLSEVYAMFIAYSLRNPSAKGVDMKDMGGFVGQLLLRSIDRAERVYHAMQCRGYPCQWPIGHNRPFTAVDFVFTALTVLACVVFRLIPASGIWGGLI